MGTYAISAFEIVIIKNYFFVADCDLIFWENIAFPDIMDQTELVTWMKLIPTILINSFLSSKVVYIFLTVHEFAKLSSFLPIKRI